MIKKSVSLALAAGLTLGAAFAASPALAVARGAGELNQDFGGPEHLGIDYNNAGVDTALVNTDWTASVSDGTNTYVAGTSEGSGWASDYVIVSKFVNGVRDDTFGGDGVAEFGLENGSASFNYVRDIQIASNGELVVFGSLWDDQTQLLETLSAFALRISATGTNTISGVWGNADGDVLEAGDELNLSVFMDPFLLNHEESWTEHWFNGAVTFNYDGMQKWVVTGGTWTDGIGENGWVVSLTDEGAINTMDGDSDAAGYQFLDYRYNIEGASGADCANDSWTNDIVFDSYENRVAVLAQCNGNPAIFAFDFSNLWPELGYGMSNGVNGYQSLVGHFDSIGGTWQLELRDIGGSFDYILGGETSANGLPWLGVVNALGEYAGESSDSTVDDVANFQNVRMEDMVVGDDDLVYFTGIINVGLDNDLWSMRWNIENQTDVTWNASAASHHQINGSCANEEVNTMALAGDQVMVFGGGYVPMTNDFDYYNDGNWAALAASVFSAAATQTAATGSAPVWEDITVNGEAWTTEEYASSIYAAGTDITYFLGGDALNEGLSLNIVEGIVEITGTPTNVGDNQWINVCAANEFGHAWTTINIDTVSPEPYAPVSTGPAELDGVTAGEPFEHMVPVDASPVATCEVTDGVLPEGLFLDADTCVISGTPTVAGDYVFVVTATNSEGSYDFEYSGTVAEESVEVVDGEEALAKTGVDSAPLTALGSFALLAVLTGAGIAMRRRESARS